LATETLTFDSVACTYAQFTGSGCPAITNPASVGTPTVSFKMIATGSPSLGATTATGNTKLFIRITGIGSDLRVLELGIDSINLSYSGGALTVSVPASAKLYLYGKSSDGGSTAAVTLVNALAQSVSITGGSTFSFNVQQVMDTVTGQFTSPFTGITSRTGTFGVQFILSSNVPLTRYEGTSLATAGTTTMTAFAAGSSGFTITGPTLSGKITVQ